jgi:acyl carrier protein
MDEDIFECLGLDSLQALDFLSKLEGEFGVTIPDSRLKDIRTFRSLVEITACN